MANSKQVLKRKRNSTHQPDHAPIRNLIMINLDAERRIINFLILSLRIIKLYKNMISQYRKRLLTSSKKYVINNLYEVMIETISSKQKYYQNYYRNGLLPQIIPRNTDTYAFFEYIPALVQKLLPEWVQQIQDCQVKFHFVAFTEIRTKT